MRKRSSFGWKDLWHSTTLPVEGSREELLEQLKDNIEHPDGFWPDSPFPLKGTVETEAYQFSLHNRFSFNNPHSTHFQALLIDGQVLEVEGNNIITLQVKPGFMFLFVAIPMLLTSIAGLAIMGYSFFDFSLTGIFIGLLIALVMSYAQVQFLNSHKNRIERAPEILELLFREIRERKL